MTADKLSNKTFKTQQVKITCAIYDSPGLPSVDADYELLNNARIIMFNTALRIGYANFQVLCHSKHWWSRFVGREPTGLKLNALIPIDNGVS